MKFLLSIFFVITFLFVSETKIEGTVYDEYIETLEGVTVEFNGKKVTTDTEGNFSLQDIKTFPVKLTFSKEGYENKEVEVKEKDLGLEIVLIEL